MNGIFLVSYRVKGIKNFEEEVSLSFYKKTITKPIDTGNYNVKGIYGMNGSGKSAIISSVNILRNLLINENYLNIPIVQSSLDEIINKKIEELHIGTKFLLKANEDRAYLYEYEVVLKKNNFGKYVIDSEQLSCKNAFSKKDEFIPVFKVKKGKIEYINTKEDIVLERDFREKTKNLLSNSTASALSIRIFNEVEPKIEAVDLYSILFSIQIGFELLIWYPFTIYIYMDPSDDHTDYFAKNISNKYNEAIRSNLETDAALISISKIFKESE